MNYKLDKQIVHNDVLRNSFIDLAIKTFDLSFKEWYRKGYWTDAYIPYALVSNNKVIANASANIIDLIWQGEPRRYIQIGTVMTDIDHRDKGLAGQLVREILKDWQDKADAFFLFANPTTVDFYPKFGFERTAEHQYIMPVVPAAGDFRKLDMDQPEEVARLQRYYQKSNHFVYYSDKNQAIAIAMQNGPALICFDIFCDSGRSLSAIINELADENTYQAILGFTPKENRTGEYEKIEGEDILFIYGQKENIFKENKLMFPLLSHA